MHYVVIGANGYVGSHLYKRLKKDGLCVIGTGHCHETKNEYVYFDVLQSSVSEITRLVEGEEKTAILCVVQSDFSRCKTDYDLSRQINVVSVKKMTEKLIQENFHVIYFSSDNVFDGKKGNYTEQSITGAISEYGKMKEEVEHFLLENYPQVCIFRMPRVVGTERQKRNLLTDFESKLADKVVRCIKDNRMSVIANEDVYQACLMSADNKMCGLYNLCNDEVYSRKELAAKFFEGIGIYDKDIVEIELEKFGFEDIRPLNTSLDNTKFKRETGYNFMAYDLMIERYLTENGYKRQKSF